MWTKGSLVERKIKWEILYEESEYVLPTTIRVRTTNRGCVEISFSVGV